MVISISTSEEMPRRNAFELSKSSPGCPHEGVSCMIIWIRSDEGLTLETSAFESLYGG